MRAIVPVIAGAAVLAVGGGSLAFAGLRSDVTLSVDGRPSQVTTTASTVGDLLAAQHLVVGPHDVVAPDPGTRLQDGTRVAVQYGRQVTVSVDGAPRTVWTTATDVGSAIAALGLDATGADLSTSRSTPVGREGLSVSMATPKRVTLTVAGRKQTLTTTGATVADALTAAKVSPDADDEVSVPVGSRLKDGARITVTRVDVERRYVDTKIRYATVEKKTSALDRGTTRTRTAGKVGQKTRTYEVVLHDGKEVSRDTVKVHTARSPRTRVLLVGTHVDAPKSTSSSKSSKSSSSSSSSSKSSSSGSGAANVGLWDRIAQCESGGDWSINTGNGYYGGLQFLLSTWHAYGGTGRPDQHSKAEQIAVAERVRKASGLSAWSCA